ncbi:putative arabinan endo-1,5-alpha-L-arabinosidase A [Pseudocercospora fuligena]|uniref:Endo-1,5-alpha-L-arabinanase A n=1 Tax=Pseudocercospora fuligena TaxID=685502 RepID=A0A8H6RMQ7_9PEZI|nr:putative arabinan endo-1,5-alpha-L-arabinosidase A [Pseudocercospora fuligena]
MRHSLSLLIASTLFLTLTQAAYPPPEPITGTIPGSVNSTLDPGLIRRASDDKLFLYTTPNDLTVFTASSLFGPWTQEPNTALYNHNDLGPGNHGAPAMYRIGESYYLYFNGHNDSANPTPGQDGLIGVATSSTLEPGSWDVKGYLDILWREKYNILDATVLMQENQNFLGFGSYQDGVFSIPLADLPITIAPNANNEVNWLAFNGTANETKNGRMDVEGSYLFQHGDYYYLFFSSGECCKRSGDDVNDPSTWSWGTAGEVYKVFVCRSQNLSGGFVDRDGRDCVHESGGTEVLASHDNVWAPGGQGVLQDDEVGGVILYYHYGELSGSDGSPPF